MSRKVVAVSVASVALGLLAFTPAAWADDDDESSVVSVHDNFVGVQVCHNQVPVNVLGVQVPIKELAASLGVPIGSDDSPQRGPDSSCNHDQTGRNNEGSTGRESGGPSSDATADGAEANRAENDDAKKDNGKDEERDGDVPGLPFL